MNTKTCTHCHQTKPIEDFSKGRGDCKPCAAKKARDKRILDPESRIKFIIGRLDEETKQQLVHDLLESNTVYAISKKYGIPNTTLCLWVRSGKLGDEVVNRYRELLT